MSALWTLMGNTGSALFGMGGYAPQANTYPMSLQQQMLAQLGMQNVFGMPPRCSLCPHCQKIEADAAQRFMETMRAAKEQRRKVVLERIAKRKIAVLSQMAVEQWN